MACCVKLRKIKWSYIAHIALNLLFNRFFIIIFIISSRVLTIINLKQAVFLVYIASQPTAFTVCATCNVISHVKNVKY
jgi:hypothetical protein